MTIKDVETLAPEAPDDTLVVEHHWDDRFVKEVPGWLRDRFERGPHRPWIRLAQSAQAARAWRTLVPVNLVLFFVLTRLDAALVVLHKPGADGYGIQALGQGASISAAAVDQWNQSTQELARVDILRAGITGVGLATAHAVVGVLFSLAWPTAFALAAVWLCRQLKVAVSAGSPRAQAARTMLGVALLVVPFTVATGVLVNVGRLTALHKVALDQVAPLLRAVTVLHGMAVLGMAIPLVVGLVIFHSTDSAGVRGLLRGLTLLRIHLLTVGTFALLLLFVSTKDQAQDVLRAWQQNPRWAIWGVLAVILFAATTGVSAAHALAQSRNRRKPPHSRALLFGVALALIAAGAVLQFGIRVGGVGFFVAGVGLGTIAFLSSLIGDSGAAQAGSSTGARPTANSPTEIEGEIAVWPALAGMLAAAPLLIVGLAVVLALIPELLGSGPRPVLLAFVAVLLFGLAAKTYRVALRHVRIPPPDTNPEPLTRDLVYLVIVPTALLALVLGSWIWLDPLKAGWQLGAIALVGFFLTGVMVAVMLMAILGNRYSPPAALAVLGFRRTPVVLLLVIWGLVGALVDGHSPLHNARVMRGSERQEPFNLDRYTDRWIGAAAKSPERRPLVFVSAAGGGIKAATWTALVVHCAFDQHVGTECPGGPDQRSSTWPSVFAVSGASGGTVGLASALAERLADGETDDTHWPQERLGTDLASGTIGWQLFEEAPLTLFRARPGGRDRAQILEEAWSRRWPKRPSRCVDGSTRRPTDEGMFALFGSGRTEGCGGNLPILFSNGTSLRDGCRFNGSVVDGAPPFLGDKSAAECTKGLDVDLEVKHSQSAQLVVTHDLADFLCADEDVRLSTAAFLSARFPYISPSGKLTGPANRGRGTGSPCDKVPDKSGTVFVGDGGYRDNTGTSTLLEVWDKVRMHLQDAGADKCITPVFVQINSGYENRSATRSSGRLYESIGPLTGGVAVFGTRDVAGPQLARARFDDHYIEFSLRAHPAVQAPLGWSLSESATEDLEHQMQLDRNKEQFEKLRDVLTEKASCTGG